jgi:streptogramin lyase
MRHRPGAVAVLLVLFAAVRAQALEPPASKDLERSRRAGTQAPRVSNTRALGNDRVNPYPIAPWQKQLARLRSKAGGRPRARIDNAIGATSATCSFTTGDEPPSFIVDATVVIVPEGSATSFSVRLGCVTTGTVVAHVARLTGDADLSVQSGATITFTPTNWNTAQTVTLFAAADADHADGSAVFRISADGFDPRDVVAAEVDNQIVAAAYDARWRAPACTAPGTGCDSGTLVRGRDSLADVGAEPNQPNTLDSGCADGTAGTYLVDESIERIRVRSVDGGPLAAGSPVFVDVDVFTFMSAVDSLDLYYGANAENPSAWTLIGTLQPAARGPSTLRMTYALPLGGVQAIRANVRRLGSPAPCTNGPYDDHDDLVFVVDSRPRILTGPGSVNIPEGGTATFQVKLNRAPATSATASVVWQAGDPDISVLNGASLVFSAANWDVWQTVTLAAGEDADFAAGTASIIVSSGDLLPATVTATETDNDTVTIVVDGPDWIVVPEGGTVTVNVKLTRAPASEFTASVERVVGDSDLSVPGGSSITFTADNWNLWQPIVLAAAPDDDAAIGGAVFRIGHPAGAREIVALESDENGQALVATTRTLAGRKGDPGSVDGRGASARFEGPDGIAVDDAGTVYVTDTGTWTSLRKITASGDVSTFVPSLGTGRMGLAVGRDGTVYAADYVEHVVKTISADGTVGILAGKPGVWGAADGTGDDARFHSPYGIAVDPSGTVYVADSASNTIRRVTPGGVVTTVAGFAGTSGSSDGTGRAARFNGPWGLCSDVSGNVYVTERANRAIRKITPQGVVSTIRPVSDTGTSLSFWPEQIAADAAGNLYVLAGETLYEVSPAGVTRGISGYGLNPGTNDGIYWLAQFRSPSSLAVDWTGGIFVADRGNAAVRKLTFELAPVPDTPGPAVLEGGGPEYIGVWLSAAPVAPVTISAHRISGDPDITVVGDGVLVFTPSNWSVIQHVRVRARADRDAANHSALIRLSSPGLPDQDIVATETDTTIGPDTLAVRTVAGGSTSGYADGVGADARFAGVEGIAVDNAGNLYVAESYNAVVRKVTPDGTVTTVAGVAGSHGTADGGPGVGRLGRPRGIVRDAAGNLFVTDVCTIRKIDPTGNLSTFVGDPASCGVADGTGSSALFSSAHGLTIDAAGTLYVTDDEAATVRAVTPAGVVTTIAGTANKNGVADGTGPAARFSAPFGIAVDDRGVLYVADRNNCTIRRIGPGAQVTTLAGSPGSCRHSDGIGASARLMALDGLALARDGSLYAMSGAVVRRVSTTGIVSTVAGGATNFFQSDGAGYAVGLVGGAAIAVQAETGAMFLGDAWTVRRASPVAAWPERVITSTDHVWVNEGATAAFQVKLGAQPSGSVTVTASCINGDSGLSVEEGSSITFGPADWDIYKAVTVRAPEDGDTVNGFDMLRVSTPGYVQKDVAVDQVDNDKSLTFTDNPLVARVTVIRAVHLAELRNAVAALRVRHNLGVVTWTDDPLTSGVTAVKAVQLAELRTALDEAYAAAMIPPPAYGTLPSGGQSIGAAHINELRAAIAAIW